MLAAVLNRLESVILVGSPHLRSGTSSAAGGSPTIADQGTGRLTQPSSLTLLVALAKLGQPVSRELHFAALQSASQYLDVSVASAKCFPPFPQVSQVAALFYRCTSPYLTGNAHEAPVHHLLGSLQAR